MGSNPEQPEGQETLESLRSVASSRQAAKGRDLPRWAPVTGLAFAMLAILGVGAAYLKPPENEAQGWVLITFVALCLAFSAGFLGGTAAVKLKIPLVKDYALSGSFAGGIAVFLGVWLAGLRLVPVPSTTTTTSGTEGETGKTKSPGPSRLDLQLAVDASLFGDTGGRRPNLSFWPRVPKRRPEYRAAFQQSQGEVYAIPGIDVPAADQRYEADFRAVQWDATRQSQSSKETHLCFVRNAENKKDARSELVTVGCSGDRQCRVDAADDGWARDCDGSTGWFFDGLIKAAHAETRALSWSVPAPDTLAARQQDPNDDPPYTLFTIETTLPRDAAWSGRRLFTYAIKVNDVPVYVDSWKPKQRIVPFDPKAPFKLEFALQNLGFSGQLSVPVHSAQLANAVRGQADSGDIAGFEELAVTLFFMNENQPKLKDALQVELSRPIVSFRDAETMTTSAHGAEFRWHGRYQPSHKEDRFSIFAMSPGSAPEAKKVKTLIDRAGVVYDDSILDSEYEGAKVVAVVRPPLKAWRLQPWSNDNYGVLLGLELPNGQIRASFSEKEANQLCKFAVHRRRSFPDHTGRRPALHPTVYRYEWPPPGEPRKRGAQVECRKLR